MSEVGDFPASRATFKVYVGGTTLFEAQLDATEVVPTRPISETQLVGFELWGLEPSADYRVRLGGGDARSTHDSASGVLVVHARLFARFAAWEEGLYFESARGRTTMYVESKSAGAEGWRTRLTMHFVVLPTKLGERRYQRMFDELSGLATGLVLDLISKSRVSLGFVARSDVVLSGTSQLELRRLQAAWQKISDALGKLCTGVQREGCG